MRTREEALSARTERRDLRSLVWVFLSMILGTLFATKLWLAGRESLIWMDEVFSLGIATRPLPILLDQAALDSHPPLYYLALYGWLELADILHLDRSILWARSIGVVSWLALLGGVFLALRKRLSGSGIALVVLTLGLSPGVFQLTHDARSYCIAIGAITGAYLVAVLDLESTGSRKALATRWLVYCALAVLAVWAHNLSWLALFAIMVSWAGLSFFARSLNLSRLVAATAANALVVALSLPALFNVVHQARGLTAGAPGWMTPPSLANLARVFAIWIPLGRDASSLVAAYPILWLLAAACWASAGWAGWNALRTRKPAELGPGLALLGFSTAFIFVVSTWAAARWFEMPLFHGPRYPLLVAGVWALALSGILIALGHNGSRAVRSFVLASPWLVCGIVAATNQTFSALRDGSGLVSQLRKETISGERILFIPEELSPYFKETLATASARPLLDLCSEPVQRGSQLLVLNRWREVDSPSTLLVFTAIQYGILGEFTRKPVPEATADFELLSFKEDDWQSRFQEKVCPSLQETRKGGDPASIRMEANLAQQLQSDGWSYLEFDRSLRDFRWTRKPTALLRFPDELAPGQYELLIEASLAAGSDLDLEIVGLAASMRFSGTSKAIVAKVPFTVPGGRRQPIAVRLSCTTRPSTSGAFSRELGVRVSHASIEERNEARE